ncbi:phosphotriesterase family protein [Amycolatopsis taiwanensis]|uniref:phosphotriesterase family protein n=1 Tax=Amycolatopsis taiwanensis TaxID=342230 RepID=UPI0004881503|nr:hypothetical protein [Amycolatopsis taiwanensis]
MGDPVVQTVLGPVGPQDLGHTQTHEHLFIDVRKPPPPGASPEFLRRDQEDIRLDNYYYARRHRISRHSRLDSVVDAKEEIAFYRAAGGGTIVDATPRGLGRDPRALREVSEASGVHVVMGSGYYIAAHQPPEVAAKSSAEITREIVDDLTIGVDGVRAGIIGEIGASWPMHPQEAKVLDAAVKAQRETGASLLLHPGRDRRAPIDLIRRVEKAGGDLSRTIMSHVDRTLFSVAELAEVASTGCVVEFDLFGQESSHYEYADIDMPNDATRIDYLIALRDLGRLDRLVIAQDICHRTHLRKYGGEGYAHILENVVPMMRRKGLSAADIETITVGNPSSLLSLRL